MTEFASMAFGFRNHLLVICLECYGPLSLFRKRFADIIVAAAHGLGYGTFRGSIRTAPQSTSQEHLVMKGS